MIWRRLYRVWASALNPTKLLFSNHRSLRLVAVVWIPWWGKVGYWLDDKAADAETGHV